MVKYYVSPTGSDSNSGTSISSPFKTLAKAFTVIDGNTSADEIEVADGTYVDQPSALITGKNNFKVYAAANANPVIKVDPDLSYNCIQIKNSSNFSIQGLELVGNNAVLDYAGAYAARNSYVRQYNINGIVIENSHHFVVKKCIVHDFPAGGIALLNTDYATVEDNIVYNNTDFSRYGCQGISFLNAFNSPGAVADTERLIARRNVAFNNINQIPWYVNGLFEGSGLYSDTTREADVEYDPNQTAYTGKALFEGNVSVFNGYAGIQSLKGCKFTVKGNYVAGNGVNVPATGEIHVNTLPVAYCVENKVCTDSDRLLLYAKNITSLYFKNGYLRGSTLTSVTNCPTQQLTPNTYD